MSEPSPNPVPGVGHFNRTLLGHFWRAAKQLADFAAFAIARTQWLVAKGNLKDRDLRFLRLVSAERLCIINLPLVKTSVEDLGTAKYDEILRRDRRSKGLPDDPPGSPRRH